MEETFLPVAAGDEGAAKGGQGMDQGDEGSEATPQSRRLFSGVPTRSKLTLGLLALSIPPLVILGWFVCNRVNDAQRATAMEVQKACQRGTDKAYSLSQQAARQKAEEIAAEVVAFLERNPQAPLRDLARVGALERALKQDVTTGFLTSIDLLLDERPLSFVQLAAPAKASSAQTAEGKWVFHARTSGVVVGQEVRRRPRKPYTYVANVRGTNLKVAATTQDLGVESVVNELAGTIQSIGESTERNTYRTADDLRAVLVFGVVAIILGVTVINGQVARAVTRPISKLTAAARNISCGSREVDLEVGGGPEVQALAHAFQKATMDLQEYAASLESKNLELDIARKIAEQNSRELQEAQEEMMQMEKMSSLGRLVAGVAHEINTPTGAIYNVSAAAANSLDVLIEGLGRLRAMAVEDFDEFQHFLDMAVARQLMLDRVSREDKLQLRQNLREAGIENAKVYAELLAKCHITDPNDGVRLAGLLEKYGVRSVFTGLLEIHAGAAISRTSADKIAKIVRALKFYSHGNENQDAKSLVDINRTIKDALIILHNRIKHRADVELDLADGLPAVKCTGGVTEIWVNLLTNACDAINEQGEDARGTIKIRSFAAGKELKVSVLDNGVPIAPDIVSKIFDPFFTTKAPGKGTGLGLSLVMSTVTRDGGSVTIKEQDGFKGFEVAFLPDGTESGTPAGDTQSALVKGDADGA